MSGRLDRLEERLERWAQVTESWSARIDRVSLVYSVVMPWLVGTWALGAATVQVGAALLNLDVSGPARALLGLAVGPPWFAAMLWDARRRRARRAAR